MTKEVSTKTLVYLAEDIRSALIEVAAPVTAMLDQDPDSGSKQSQRIRVSVQRLTARIRELKRSVEENTS